MPYNLKLIIQPRDKRNNTTLLQYFTKVSNLKADIIIYELELEWRI